MSHDLSISLKYQAMQSAHRLSPQHHIVPASFKVLYESHLILLRTLEYKSSSTFYNEDNEAQRGHLTCPRLAPESVVLIIISYRAETGLGSLNGCPSSLI